MPDRPTRCRIAASALASAAALCGATILVAPADRGDARSVAPAGELTITGSIDGLFPGFSGVLSARVSKPFAEPVVLTSVAASGQSTSSGCERFLIVAPYTGRTVVAAGADVAIPLIVTFDRAATDACQGVTIPLVFTGRATEVTSTADAAGGIPGVPDVPGGVLPTSGADIRPLAAGAISSIGLGLLATTIRRRRKR